MLFKCDRLSVVFKYSRLAHAKKKNCLPRANTNGNFFGFSLFNIVICRLMFNHPPPPHIWVLVSRCAAAINVRK